MGWNKITNIMHEEVKLKISKEYKQFRKNRAEWGK